MDEKPENRKTKTRSPNFPFITLEKALERARQFYDAEKRGSAPLPVVAEHWRYSPNSSGVLQTAAALKSYGLMSDEGAGDARQLRLTDLALRILLDTRPDSSERDSFRRQAARAPAVAADVYTKWEGRLPSEPNLNHYLVLEKGFSEETAAKVCEIIFLNELLVSGPLSMMESYGSEIGDDDGGITSPAYNPSGPVGPAATPWPTSGPTGPTASARQTPRPGEHVVPAKFYGGGPARRDERFIGPTGDIMLSFFGGEPTWETYEFLRKYIELRQSMLTQSFNPLRPSIPEAKE